MNQTTVNTVKITSVKLHAGGRWLVVSIDNAGVSSQTHFYPTRNCTTSEVQIQNMSKDTIRQLKDQLVELCKTWKISSGNDVSFTEEL